MVVGVNWHLLSNAIHYYEWSEYVYRDVSWSADPRAISVTCPDPSWIVKTQKVSLVGSAEQSFIDLDLKGQLGKGKWVSCTPCFRNDEEDELHQHGFMKVELYVNSDPSPRLAHLVALRAYDFFRRCDEECADYLDIVETEHGYDIEMGGIEIGSYGYRESNGLAWVYGTGIAEPRFSTAMAKTRLSQNLLG